MIADSRIDQFVDTNILVYAFDLSAGDKHTVALQLMEGWWKNGNGCISIQVFQEFYDSVTRKIIHPLDHTIARQIVADLSNWRLHAPEGSDVLKAIDFQQIF